MRIIEKTVKEIKTLQIQGATAIAKAALDALAKEGARIQDTKILQKKIQELVTARPTEPLTQNCLDYVLWRVEKGQSLKQTSRLILARLEDVEREIVENALALFKPGVKILTHCHSETVEEILKMAQKKEFVPHVFLTETRPKYQGRITAKNLLAAGLKVTLVTDSEAAFLVSREDQQEIDLVILGADAIGIEGWAFNKVGSYGIALAAKTAQIPFYLAATLLKVAFHPLIIEERPAAEVWEKRPKKLEILNPAFDKIPAELITGYITEFGILKPEKIKRAVKENYPWIMQIVNRQSSIVNRKKDRPYLSYLHLKERVDPQKHILATFRLETIDNFLEVAGGVAAESSVGTWTEVTTELKNVWEKLHARVLEAQRASGLLKIAYPLALFEPGNLPQLLSCVAGNIFGLREVEKLRLEDLELPEVYVKGFAGPQIGMPGIRKIVGVSNRPLLGCIIKPKEGLDAKRHTALAMEVYTGGVDLVKDDENLTSQKFNPFEDRVRQVTKSLTTAGYTNKIYAFNITAPAGIMEKRARLIKEKKGNCLMIDILTVGFSALQFIRQKNYGLIIHGHRAGHAALTRDPKQGISMLVLAKLARLSGVDSLHTGTVVGKMGGQKEEVVKINQFLLADWFGLKPVLPVASGGLYPQLIPDLVKIFGKDCLLNFGGGIHGHPWGPKAGAKAVFQALEAQEKGIALSDYALTYSELDVALKHWGDNG